MNNGELSTQGTEAILRLDTVGTTALITATERATWNKKVAIYILEFEGESIYNNGTKQVTLLTELNQYNDDEFILVLKKESIIYPMVSRTLRDNGCDYTFDNGIYKHVIQFAIGVHNSFVSYFLYHKYNSSVKGYVDTHANNTSIHISETEQAAWNEKVDHYILEFDGDPLNDRSHYSSNLETLNKLYLYGHDGNYGKFALFLKIGSFLHPMTQYELPDSNDCTTYTFSVPHPTDKSTCEYTVEHLYAGETNSDYMVTRTFGITVDNINTLSVSGKYFAEGSATGVPNSSYSWFIDHSSNGLNYATQTAIAESVTPIVKYRIKNNGTWSNWEGVYTSSEVDNKLPITIPRSEYDVLVANNTYLPGRIYDVLEGV